MAKCNTCNKEIIGEVFSTYGFESWVPHCSESCRLKFGKCEGGCDCCSDNEPERWEEKDENNNSV